MNRRAALTLTGMALMGLAVAALPQSAFAQSSPLIGTWKLNRRPGGPPQIQQHL